MNLLAETEWKNGDKCYAIFSEDDLYYPAIITKIYKGDYHVTFEFYGNEEVKTIDEIEEVEVIEGEDGDENPYNHYERTRHLFDAPEKNKKESSQQKKSEKKPKRKERKTSSPVSTTKRIPRMPAAELIPPPPPGADEDLCQLLLSFFIAGYQSGIYTANTTH